MDLTSLSQLLDSKAVIGALSAVGGSLVTMLVALYRDRIRVLEYTVTHDRLGLSADDAVFGSVRVTWEGRDLRNLYASTLVLENTTTVDFTNLKVKVFTGDTLLLNERSEIAGTTYLPAWTDEFRQSLQLAGEQPTEAQIYSVRHHREYILPVFNRGQRLVLTYLTTIPNPDAGPSIWLDMMHPSAQVVFRPLTPQIYGVPVRVALPLGLLACVAILVGLVAFVTQPWIVGLIALVSGLTVQATGAGLFRVLRFLKKLIVR